MVQKRTCDYTGEDIEPGTGIMYVANDGTILHFVDSKAEKNYLLGREARDLEWTAAGRANKGPAQEQVEPEPEPEPVEETETEGEAEGAAPDLEAVEEDAEEVQDDAEAVDADVDEEAEDTDADADEAEAQADDEEDEEE